MPLRLHHYSHTLRAMTERDKCLLLKLDVQCTSSSCIISLLQCSYIKRLGCRSLAFNLVCRFLMINCYSWCIKHMTHQRLVWQHHSELCRCCSVCCLADWGVKLPDDFSSEVTSLHTWLHLSLLNSFIKFAIFSWSAFSCWLHKVLLQQIPKVWLLVPYLTWSNSGKIDRLKKNLK